jgi:hypothetical protein
MSNIFLKNELGGLFDSITESNVSLPKFLNVIDNAKQTDPSVSEIISKMPHLSTTSMNQAGGNNSITSSFIQAGGNNSITSSFIQAGGSYSATSSQKDVNKLISMLTSETSDKLAANSETSSVALENQLREILNQGGGMNKSKNSKKLKGGANKELTWEEVKKQLLKGNINININPVEIIGKIEDQIINNNNNIVITTTTEMPSTETDKNKIDLHKLANLTTTSENDKPMNLKIELAQSPSPAAQTSAPVAPAEPAPTLAQTSAPVAQTSAPTLGANNSETLSQSPKIKRPNSPSLRRIRKMAEKEAARKAAALSPTSVTPSQNNFGQSGGVKTDHTEQEGGMNPGFQAFLDMKKFIAEKLKISNGPKAAKVAGAVQKDMKEKHKDANAVELAKLGKEHFLKNIEHYKQML